MTYTFKLARRLAENWAFSAFVVILTACAAGETTGPLAPPPDGTPVTPDIADTLLISPQNATARAGQRVTFTVGDWTSRGNPVSGRTEWTASGGTIDSSGVFSATQVGEYTVSARRGGKAGRARITVTAAVVTAIVITPDSGVVAAGGRFTFSATARRSDGTSGAVVADWTATGGSIDTAGTFTAGGTAGTYRVIARERGGTLADTATIRVTAAAATLTALVLNPAQVSLQRGAQQQFSASGTWSDGTTAPPPVTWTATGGTVTSGGIYTAGQTPGTYRVIAQHTGGTLVDTSVVTIVAPTLTSLSLLPATVSLAPAESRQFSVSGTWSDGGTSSPTVTWTATGGTISASGLYTAGSTAGTFRVIAQHTGGTLADTSAVTITAPAPTLTSIELTPASASLQGGATQQFSVIGRRSDGTIQAVTPTFTATGGTITSGGLYTAGATAGTFRVIATASGFADTSTVTITAASPTLVGIELTPAIASVTTGGTQQFTVVGRRSDGTTQSVTATYTATGGTITTGGLFTAGTAAGSFRVVASASGFADTSSVTITAPGTYLPPDLYSTDFEDAGRDREWDVYGPGTSVTNAGGYQHIQAGCGVGGGRCLRLNVSGGSLYNRVGFVHANQQRVQRGFFRYAFRCASGCQWDNTSGNNIKLHRFMTDLGSWYGTVKLEGAMSPFWEGGESGLRAGLAWGTADSRWTWNNNPVTRQNLADGQWHTLEVEYDVNAGADARMRYWIDGLPVLLTPGSANWDGGGGAWVTTRFVAATDGGPTWIQRARDGNTNAGVVGITFLETISQAANSGVLYIDNVAASTRRIGP